MESPKLQLIGSYQVFSNGVPQGTYDLTVVNNPGGAGSTETISNGMSVTVKPLPSGVPDEMTMDSQQAFEAVRFMQDRTQSIQEAFGTDILPAPQGVQIQGVVARVSPPWLNAAGCGGDDSGTSTVAKIAFILRGDWLTVSTRDRNGNWHSDSTNVAGALAGLTLAQLIDLIIKIVDTIHFGWKAITLAIACAASTTLGPGALIACALGVIALELLSIFELIRLIEEVTGQKYLSAALDNAHTSYTALNFGTAKTQLVTARADLIEYLETEFEHPNLGSFLGGFVPQAN
jgi:hypothetical protein